MDFIFSNGAVVKKLFTVRYFLSGTYWRSDYNKAMYFTFLLCELLKEMLDNSLAVRKQRGLFLICCF